MKLFLLTSRDTESNHLNFTLSFTVSYGLPSRLSCTDGNSVLFNPVDSRGPFVSTLSREVIRSQYVDSSNPDMTRVKITLTGQPRAAATYTCTVYVEGRINPPNRLAYNFRQMGNAATTANITGECITTVLKLHCSSISFFSSQLLASPLVSWPTGQASTVLWSPGLSHHHHQLSMKCFIR